MVRGAGKSEEQNLLSEKSSSPRHRRRPLHTLCSSLFLPRPRPTTSRDPFRPRHQPPSGASSERRVRRVGVSLTRVCVCRAAWRRTVCNMCTIKYTQKCLLSLALSCLRSPFPSVARARIRGEHACIRVHVQLHTGWVCFQHRNPRYRRGFHVPDTRPPCSRSLNTISSFNRGTAARILFLFSLRAHNTCTFLAPRIRRMLLGDVAIRGWFYPQQMGFAGARECRVNRITSFLSREQETE